MMMRRILLALGLAYALVCCAVSQRYRSMLYPAPSEDHALPPAAARAVTTTASDGVPVHAIEFPRRGTGWVVVHFHGNGEVIGSHLDLAKELGRRGFGTLLVEYRGYGRSRDAGQPTEAGLYADASAALDHLLAEGIGPERVALWGFSLGTGVASEMAYRGRGSRLILEAPYTSVPAVGARLYRTVPASWVIADRYDTESKAKAIRIPTFLFHGDQDRVIPASMPARLNKLFPDVRLAEIEGGDHADLLSREGEWLWHAVSDFIEKGNAPVLRRSLPGGRRR
jgi:alpha-beta hydrolase superfamily lysophospholipase